MVVREVDLKKLLRKERDRLAKLHQAVEFLGLAAERSLEETLDGIAKTIGKALGTYGIAIWRITEDGKSLKIVVVQGLSRAYCRHFRQNPILLAPEIEKFSAVGKAAITKKPVFISNIWTDRGIKKISENVLAMIKQEGFASVCSFPLIAGKTFFGVLNFYFFQPHRYFASERYLLQTAVKIIAIAIDNARYHQQAKEYQSTLFNMLEDTEEARKIAEKEKNKTLAVITNLADGLLVFGEENKLSLINPQAEHFFDIKSREIIDRPIFELSSFPGLARLMNLIGEEIKTVFRKELSIKEQMTLEVSTIPMLSGKENLGNLVILHDITREKMIEQIKTEFVALAAHQLRTPLSAIKWTLKMLLDGDMGEISQEQRELVGKAYQSNERMISLINDLLDVARIEEGRYLFKPILTGLEPIVQFVINAYQGEIKRRGIKFQFEKPEKKLPPVRVDVEKIRLAIQNIIENAIKYTSPGGEIKVLLRYDKKEIEFQTRDNGVGIPKDQQDRVFSKFFRASNVMRMETEGSGLGLFITKNIIEAHGGKIWFESEEGRGTTFYFALPLG